MTAKKKEYRKFAVIMIRKAPLYGLVCIYIFVALPLWSQDSTTAKNDYDYQSIVKANPKDIYDTHYMLENHVWQYVDSSLINFHRYNPVENLEIPMLIMSNLGQAYTPITFYCDRNVGYRHGFDAFERYLFTTSSQRYFKTLTPYSSIYYMVGGKAEQTVDALYAQNIKKNSSVSFNIRRYFSDGKIPNNKSQVQNVSLNNFTATKNKKYELLAAYIFNKVNNQEYGGSAIANVYNDKVYSSRLDALPTLLTDATYQQKSHTLQIKHYLHLNKKTSLILLSYYQKFENIYSDKESTSTYYTKYYLDSNATYDNFTSKKYLQQIGIGSHPQNPLDSVADVSQRWWQISLSGSYIHNNNIDIEKKIGDAYIYAEFGSNPYYKGYFRHHLEGKFQVAPKYIGDMLVTEKLWWTPIEMISLEQEISWKIQSPSWMQTQYSSNHFLWENDFAKMYAFHSSTNMTIPKWKTTLSVTYDWNKNYIYFDTTATPRQYGRSLNVIACTAKQQFDFKNFFISGIFHVQYSGPKEVLPLPLAFINTQFYYKGRYFKNKINAQLGAEIFYYTPYKSLAYMPATARFYTQVEEVIKPQPRVDIFFNIAIKKAKIFFKYQYVNNGIPKKGYYVAPNYLSQDRGFKVGAKWDFFD